MKTLARAVASREAVGTHIPLPWRALEKSVTLRTKELVMVAGAPGGGKSTLTANMAVQMDEPVLYCAQDSPGSILARMTALNLGQETHDIQMSLSDKDIRAQLSTKLAEMVRETLIFNRGAITIEKLKQMCLALTEWIGKAPSVIFIDNLIDLIVPGHSYHDTTFYATALPELKRLAQEIDTSIIVLHHVTRGGGTKHGQGQSPLALNDLLYAGEREARHVWGVYNDGGGIIHLQILKQQDGPADPGGEMTIPLRWYPVLGKLASVEA